MRATVCFPSTFVCDSEHAPTSPPPPPPLSPLPSSLLPPPSSTTQHQQHQFPCQECPIPCLRRLLDESRTRHGSRAAAKRATVARCLETRAAVDRRGPGRVDAPHSPTRTEDGQGRRLGTRCTTHTATFRKNPSLRSCGGGGGGRRGGGGR